MLSATKLYRQLNTSFVLIALLVLIVSIIWLVCMARVNESVIRTSQFVQNSVDDARQNIREDLQKITSKLKSQNAELLTIENLSMSRSEIADTHTIVNVSLVRYVAELEICSEKYRSYIVKVDFYGINPRIESNRLLVIDERFFWDYEARNIYLPILDSKMNMDANICWMKIISASNK